MFLFTPLLLFFCVLHGGEFMGKNQLHYRVLGRVESEYPCNSAKEFSKMEN